MKDILLGISTFLQGFRFAMRNGMWWMFILPALLWVLLAVGLFSFVNDWVDMAQLWAAEKLNIPLNTTADEGLAGFWQQVKAFLNSSRDVLISVVLYLASAYLLLLLNKYIVLIVLSPLFAYASERTEVILTGADFPFSWQQLLKDAWRGALIAARNGVAEISITIVCWALTLFVPFFAPVTALFLFLVSAYFYGFSMFDYVYERRRMKMRESIGAMRKNRKLVIANGAMFSLLMKVPLLGMTLAPIMASVGASLAFVEKSQRTAT